MHEGEEIEDATIPAPKAGVEDPSYEWLQLARTGGAHPVMLSRPPKPPPVAPPPREPTVGDRLGSYYLLERVGQGGMARVFRASHEKLQRTVAIKVLRKDAADKDGLARFLLEARAVNRIRHPNIIEVVDIVEGPVGGVSYLVMEWLEGRTLSERRRECGGRIPLAELLPMLCDVARGLHAAHGAGLVHRDLKPANIFLAKPKDGGRVLAKVIDFGAALDQQEKEAKEERYLVGTLFYLAPEQMLGLGGDHRIDLYALGLILYELCLGDRPFAARSLKEMLAQRLRAIPSMRRSAPRGVFIPRELDRIFARCVAPHPMERYADAKALADDLEALSSRLHLLKAGRATPRALLLAAPLVLLAAIGAPLLLERRLPPFLRLRSQPSPQSVEIKIPIQVQSAPPGAQLSFRGQVLGTTPCTVPLPLGPQEVELRWPGKPPLRQLVDVRRDGPAEMKSQK